MSNLAHVSSSLLLRCLTNQINQRRIQEANWEALQMYKQSTQHSTASHIGHQQEAVPTVIAKELEELLRLLLVHS